MNETRQNFCIFDWVIDSFLRQCFYRQTKMKAEQCFDLKGLTKAIWVKFNCFCVVSVVIQPLFFFTKWLAFFYVSEMNCTELFPVFDGVFTFAFVYILNECVLILYKICFWIAAFLTMIFMGLIFMFFRIFEPPLFQNVE